MLKRLGALAITSAVWMFSPFIHAQVSQTNTPLPRPSVTVHVDGWGKPVPGPLNGPAPGPAPKRDLTGIWEPTPGYRDGVFATGPKEEPSDGKHVLPFTPEGEKAWKANKPGFGTTAVPIAFNNDPFNICDPLGFPRVELFNLRAVQIFQTPKQVAMIYQNDQVWRNIWMDGRELPKEIDEPRWYGYSVGKWVDDTTFVVDTVGLDTRTWIDNVGRPHSDELKVVETFHRVNHDLMELTLTIIDPKMYAKPWVALNKFTLRLQPDWFDIREMVCSASEAAEYNKTVSEAAGASLKKK
jgi:hypothetical protein